MAVNTAYSNVKVKYLVIQGGSVSLNGTVCGHLASVLDLGILRVPSLSLAGYTIYLYIFLRLVL